MILTYTGPGKYISNISFGMFATSRVIRIIHERRQHFLIHPAQKTEASQHGKMIAHCGGADPPTPWRATLGTTPNTQWIVPHERWIELARQTCSSNFPPFSYPFNISFCYLSAFIHTKHLSTTTLYKAQYISTGALSRAKRAKQHREEQRHRPAPSRIRTAVQAI